ncbi:MAG: hypothetical protein ABR961_04250 [Thermoanaerobaculaceae bacterium]|jgi:hypothetical protein
MAESAPAKKMKLKAGARAAVVNAPAGYLKELAPLPSGVEITEKLQGPLAWIQVFVATSAELKALVPKVIKALAPESLLWISFPKGTSGVQTDLTRDKGWDALADADLKWVTLISVNATWSAFALRPYRPGEAKKHARR